MLLFLIVKHNTGAEVGESNAQELEMMHAEELAQLNDEKDRLSEQLNVIGQRKATEREQKNKQADQLATLKAKQNELASLNRQTELEKARKSVLENEIISIQPAQSTDVISDPQVGEEEYLLGMKVEGQRIAILIDRSASMTDELLIDIIARKIRSNADKKKGPKWKRTTRTAKWLLNRLPKNSNVIVIAYNDRARMLNGGRWVAARDGKVLQSILDEINQVVPTGATNLEAALRALQKVSPATSDIYIVTDGLPTKSVSSSGLLSNCNKNTQVISGKCRQMLFQTSLSKSAPPKSKKVNVILLPLEGDPQAAPEYWNWTAGTGGLLLIPAAGWP